MPTASRSPLLTEDDLVRTYTNRETPIETVQQFRQAHELRGSNPDRSRASIAREVGRPTSSVRRWLVDGARPPEIKAIEQAKAYGWLPLNADDRVFDTINLIIAWAYAGGWINPDTYQPSLTVNDRLHWAIASHVLTPLGIDWRSIREENEDHTHEVRPRDGGALLGRVLHALGTPKGRKTNQEIALPEYLDRVEPYHRRQFGRMYLLHRGAPAIDILLSLKAEESRAVGVSGLQP